MTRRECLLEILKNGEKITSTEICNKFYELYPTLIEEKRQSYINKNVNKTEDELWTQFRAELISFMTQHDSTNSFMQIKEEGKTYYCLKNIKPSEIQEIQPTTIIVPKEREIVYQLTCEELSWKCLTIYKDDDHLNHEITECSEYTYIFDDNTKLKIGRTSQENPIKRLEGMKTANPTIHVDIIFPSTQYSEKELHNKFDDSRMDNNREWFHKTKSLMSFTTEHKKKNEKALELYYKQKDIKDIEKHILNWDLKNKL